MFIVVAEDNRGRLIGEHALHPDTPILTIGRTPDNDLTLPNGAVSRYHAQIQLQNGQAVIVDIRSSNGVLINDRPISGPTVIDENAQIRIGEYRIFLERGSGQIEERPQAGLNTAILNPGHAHGKLVITSGKHAGHEHLLFDPICRIGRTDENDVCLPDVSVSRYHARLQRRDNGTYVLTDLSSSNGTLLRGRRLKKATRAAWGDRIQFGHVECLLVNRDGQGQGGIKRWIILAVAITAAALLGAAASLLVN